MASRCPFCGKTNQGWVKRCEACNTVLERPEIPGIAPADGAGQKTVKPAAEARRKEKKREKGADTAPSPDTGPAQPKDATQLIDAVGSQDGPPTGTPAEAEGPPPGDGSTGQPGPGTTPQGDQGAAGEGGMEMPPGAFPLPYPAYPGSFQIPMMASFTPAPYLMAQQYPGFTQTPFYYAPPVQPYYTPQPQYAAGYAAAPQAAQPPNMYAAAAGQPAKGTRTRMRPLHIMLLVFGILLLIGGAITAALLLAGNSGTTFRLDDKSVASQNLKFYDMEVDLQGEQLILSGNYDNPDDYEDEVIITIKLIEEGGGEQLMSFTLSLSSGDKQGFQKEKTAGQLKLKEAKLSSIIATGGSSDKKRKSSGGSGSGSKRDDDDLDEDENGTSTYPFDSRTSPYDSSSSSGSSSSQPSTSGKGTNGAVRTAEEEAENLANERANPLK